ncbi:MAG TPA: 2Fe-2S iron-sulfur cluster-binding protein [Actinomycetota bacterium]|nr:2Fe-2S iron-sulfur cluster-binding protein [Actinomycetota bacterium]
MPVVRVVGDGVVECAEGDTVLRAALRAGLGFPYACNTGSCGTCRFQLLEGAVEHLRADPPAWTERDRERNRWLGCQARPLGDVTVKVRLDPEQVPPHRPVVMEATLVEVTPITHDLSGFAFELEGPDDFCPGQYALLHLEGVDGARGYSMANLPGEGRWWFLIKRVPGGAGTGVLFDRLRPGDRIVIDGPYGNAYLRPDRPGDLLLVAGGSGLAPIVSIARSATNEPSLADREIHLFYGGRQPRDLDIDAVLATIPGFHDRVTYVAAVSDPPPGWAGPSGFVHAVVRDRLGGRLPGFEAYFAGPPPMVQAMQRMLCEAGVPMDHLHFDEFL